MSSVASSPGEDSQWTLRVNGPATREGEPLVVHGRNLMPLVARLLADARVQDIVVRPRIREIRAHVRAPASVAGEE